MLRPLQLLQQLRKQVVPQGEVADLRAVKDGVGAAPGDVVGQSGGLRTFLLHPLHGFRVLGGQVPGGRDGLAHLVPDGPVAHVSFGVEQKQTAEHRHQHDQQQPGNLCRGVRPAVYNVQHDAHRENDHHAVDVGKGCFKPVGQSQQNQGLHQQQSDDQTQPAEQRPDQTPVAFFQQGDPCRICFIHFHVSGPPTPRRVTFRFLPLSGYTK